MISMIFLAVILILMLYFFNKDILKREAVITIVTSLPLGIFKESVEKSLIQEDNKTNIKVIEEEDIKITPKEIKVNILADTTIEENKEFTEISKEEAMIVYWTPNGKSYHMTDNCRTLSRSKVIHSGNVDQCDKNICCEQCKVKEQEK